MPLSIPLSSATKANFADVVKTFVDGLEVAVAAAQSAANAASTLAGQKYTKPVGGIPDSDRDLSTSVGYQTWNGTAWSTRPSGYGHVEAFSDGTRGSTADTAAPSPTGAVNGDRWWKRLA